MLNCNLKNERKQQRCLKDFLNGVRQLAGKPKFKTITKFKQLYGLSKEETYKLAEELNELSKNTYPAAQFEQLGAFREHLTSRYLGKVIHLLLIDGGDAVVDVVYHMPQTVDEFGIQWNSLQWDWKISETILFSAHLNGKLYITESEIITPQRILQSYMENETKNCVFKPIIDLCNKNMNDEKLSVSSKNKYKTLRNHVIKLNAKYTNGVPEEDLHEIFMKLKIKMTISLPFCRTEKIYGEIDIKKYLTTFNFINTRLNHIEDGANYNDDKAMEIPEDKFYEFVRETKRNKDWFIYREKEGHIFNIRTLSKNYKLLNGGYHTFSEFENLHKISEYKLDDIADELLSKFIRTGCHMTMSRINDQYRDKLEKYVDVFRETDGYRAYTQFKQTRFYEGFVGKITDFRRTDKIQGVGFYLITNLDWTHATPKIKNIQKTFDVWRGRNIYASPELKMLTELGVKYKIRGGCWGIKFDFDFTETMFEKVNGIYNYARWVGLMNRYDDVNSFYMDTTDTEYAGLIVKSTQEYEPKFKAHYDGNRVMFSTPKKNNYHLSQVSGFIYAYARLNLVEQLLEMDVFKIIRINTDGIKYLEHPFKQMPAFRYVKEPNKIGLVMEDREDGFLTNINSCNKHEWLRFHFHFLNTHSREHFATQLFKGAGGNGKTHYNLLDNGLVRPLYVGHSYKLIRKKADEYKNIDCEVLANLTSSWKPNVIRRNYSNIIIDEASTISEELRSRLFSDFTQSKLIFCGDIGYQARPCEGIELTETAFENVVEFKTNYRCKDPELLKVLTHLRGEIQNKKTRIQQINELQKITKPELIKIYEATDVILTYTHKTKDAYNKIIDKEKYIITVSTADFSRGDIFYTKPASKNIEKTNAFTTHSVQGETFKEKIFVDSELLNDSRLFYTAVSRAEYLSQIYIVV